MFVLGLDLYLQRGVHLRTILQCLIWKTFIYILILHYTDYIISLFHSNNANFVYNTIDWASAYSCIII